MYIYAFKDVFSRRSRFGEEWVHFSRKASQEKTLWKAQRPCPVCGSQQGSVNDLNAGLIPSFSRGGGQTVNSLSVLARAQLGSDYCAIVLSGAGGSAAGPGLA